MFEATLEVEIARLERAQFLLSALGGHVTGIHLNGVSAVLTVQVPVERFAGKRLQIVISRGESKDEMTASVVLSPV